MKKPNTSKRILADASSTTMKPSAARSSLLKVQSVSAEYTRTHALKIWDRRGFLVNSGGLLLLAGSGFYACDNGTSGDDLAQDEFAVGQVDDFAVGDAKPFNQGPFIVLRDEQGFWALTAVCTHQQCTVNVGETNLPCPCHGSVYDLDGQVVNGPASQPLSNLLVTINDTGAVFVDTTQSVSVGTRVPA